ncbi:hypothetical protein K438DRAFT_1815866 [Mycena galopus ATCC 62051]|nr:hypothetical protein K438DRAFT_1815866 [Mycena galopus ATCC 62051]
MNSTTAPARHPDFKVALGSLSSSIQNAMDSSSQTTLLRARNLFALFRNSLHDHWTEILAYLQECHTFSANASITGDDFIGEDPESVSQWLDELTSDSGNICRKSEVLVRQSDQGIECLSSLMPQLSELLRGPLKSTTGFSATYTFLEMSPPDGLAALASTSAAVAEIRTSLRMLHQFWAAVSETCRSLQKSSEPITLDRVRKLGDTWKEYRQEIVQAKVSITKSLDAVAIEPAALSISRRPQRRRGSSKSEMSISSSPRVSPRRMSSLDDSDEVPKSCWAFSIGRKR